jgi:Tol biopolymer transport system component
MNDRQSLVINAQLILLLVFILSLIISCKPEDDIKNPANYELYISKSADKTPAISPDGNLIAYYHYSLEIPEPQNYPTGLYIMNFDGSERRLVLRGANFSPSWSPDGNWIVFSADGILQITNLLGDSLRTFRGLSNLPLHSPDWSKDGKDILFSAPLTLKGGVFSISPDFSHLRQILNPIENNGMYAKWSPNKSKIIYTKGNQSWKSTEIFTLDTLFKTEVRLTNDDRDDRDPSWSTTGEFISWSSNVEIYLMKNDGSYQRKLDYGQYPSWSPDGHFIVYSNANQDFTKEVLWKIDINGKNKVQLTY